MLNPDVQDKIDQIYNRILKIFDEISEDIQESVADITHPTIGVFRKSHYDYMEDTRISFKHIGKKLIDMSNTIFITHNYQHSDDKFLQSFIDLSNEFKHKLELWGNKLAKVCNYWNFEKESAIRNAIDEFTIEFQEFGKKFMDLTEEHIKAHSPPNQELIDQCPSCNKKIDYDSIFCRYCGVKIIGKTRGIPK